MKRSNGILLFFAMILIVSGCTTVGPDYKAPEVETPAGWNQPEDPALVPSREEIRNWWTVFEDPMLTRFIKQTGETNLDLRVAVARVNEARARLGIAEGRQVPVVETWAPAPSAGRIVKTWACPGEPKPAIPWAWTRAGKSICLEESAAPWKRPPRSTRSRRRTARM